MVPKYFRDTTLQRTLPGRAAVPISNFRCTAHQTPARHEARARRGSYASAVPPGHGLAGMRSAIMPSMNKRIAAALLWFLAGWYAGAYIALLFAVPGLIGPVLGVAAAAVFAGDPMGVIWRARPPIGTAPDAVIEIENPIELAKAA